MKKEIRWAGVLLGVGLLASCSATGDKSKPESRYASLGTNRIHYLTAGSGKETLVFVHGWTCNADFWREQVPTFARKARLVFIDLPGHGQSDKPRTQYTMDFFGEAVLAVMRDAGVKKATLIGHSMGVAVICRAFAKEPEAVSALVAVDGLLRRPKVTREQAEGFIGPYRGPGYREHATKFIYSMFSNPGSEALRDRVLAEMLATPQHVMSGAMDGMFGEGQPNWDPVKVNVPVIVINSKNPMWTAEYEAYVKGLSPRSDYRVIEGAGHFLMLEKPDEFNAVLVELLEKHALVRK
jgi:pimeloyl-ACP methyl ester carboxylesterase